MKEMKEKEEQAEAKQKQKTSLNHIGISKILPKTVNPFLYYLEQAPPALLLNDPCHAHRHFKLHKAYAFQH